MEQKEDKGPWTPEEVAMLMELWPTGLSTKEIGRRTQRGKNGVIGKAHRLGLEPRPSPLNIAKSLATRRAKALKNGRAAASR